MFDRTPFRRLGTAMTSLIVLLLVSCGGEADSPAPGDSQPLATSTSSSASELTDYQLAQLDDDPNLPGVYFPPHPGQDGLPNSGDERSHVATSASLPICTPGQLAANQVINPLCYTSNPPTSGPHGGRATPFAVLGEPASKEDLVHNMEHGGVVIWYNTTDENIIQQLADLVIDQTSRRRLLVITQYTEMEPETVALTAWTRLDKFPISEFNLKRVEDFIAEHHKRYNPEGF